MPRYHISVLITVGLIASGIVAGCKQRRSSGSSIQGIKRVRHALTLDDLVRDMRKSILIWQLFESQVPFGSAQRHIEAIDELMSKATLLQDKAVLQRMRLMWRYLSYFSEPATSLGHTRESGELMTNEEYLQTIRTKTTVPAWYNNKTFLNLLDNKSAARDTALRDYLRAIDRKEGRTSENRIRFFRFKHMNLGSGDSSEPPDLDRLVFWIPALPPTYPLHLVTMFSGSDLGTMSSIAVDPATRNPYYYDQINSSTEGIVQPAVAVIQNSCSICHKSGGPMPIYPKNPESLGMYDSEDITQFNTFVRQGAGTHHSVFDQAWKAFPADAPHLDIPERLDETKLAAFIDPPRKPSDLSAPNEVAVTAQTVQRLRMNFSSLERCSTCHDGGIRGKLLPPYGATVLRLVETGAMPPGNRLQPDERKLLAAYMKESYIDAFMAYLKRSDSSTPPSP